MRAAHRSTQSLHAWTHVRRRARSNPARTWYRALATSGLCRYCGSLLFGMDCTGRLFRACDPVQSFTASKTPGLCFRRPNHHDTPSQYSRLQHGWLLFGALPEHAGIALERHKPLAGIGPVLLLLEGDVIDRLAASAALKERARNVDHVPRAPALVDQRRAATPAETSHGARCLLLETANFAFASGDTKALAPGADVGRVNGAMR